MTTATGYGIFNDTGAAGPSAGDEISGGLMTSSIDTQNDAVLGTSVVNYPSLGGVSGTFFIGSDGEEYFVPDDATGFPPNEMGTTQSFTAAVTGSSGDDSLTGTEDGELILGDEHFNPTGTGADTILGGGGDDVIYGEAGDDTFVMADGGDTNTISDFDLGDSDGDGATNDQLDVSGLTDVSGDPVNVQDVVVSDDGSGNARLTFPNGEQLILKGIAPGVVDAPTQVSMGVPCFTSGTLIASPDGAHPVETLRPGDHVLTDTGVVLPILWMGQREVGGEELRLRPDLCPITIRAGALGNSRDLRLSPQHRV